MPWSTACWPRRMKPGASVTTTSTSGSMRSRPSIPPTISGAIGELGQRPFVEALDYVGLDFFPDVFRPVAADGQPGDLRRMVVFILRAIRESWMPAAGIPASVPLHIAENGWPTSPDRSYERQAAALETIIRTIHGYRGNYHITHYQLFDLRDADSSNPDIFYQFGILRDDYTPKPAFEVYRRLIAELGAS